MEDLKKINQENMDDLRVIITDVGKELGKVVALLTQRMETRRPTQQGPTIKNAPITSKQNEMSFALELLKLEDKGSLAWEEQKACIKVLGQEVKSLQAKLLDLFSAPRDTPEEIVQILGAKRSRTVTPQSSPGQTPLSTPGQTPASSRNSPRNVIVPSSQQSGHVRYNDIRAVDGHPQLCAVCSEYTHSDARHWSICATCEYIVHPDCGGVDRGMDEDYVCYKCEPEKERYSYRVENGDTENDGVVDGTQDGELTKFHLRYI